MTTVYYILISFALLCTTTISINFKKYLSYHYIAFSFLIIVLCLLKPLGTGQDDINYVDIVKSGCTSFTCEDKFSYFRDFVWFLLVSPYSVIDEFVSIKIVASIALLVKLILIYKMSDNKLFALTTYVYSFYFMHDLTQYRAALAATFYLLSIYYASRLNYLLSLASIFSSIFSHIQALTILLVYVIPKRDYFIKNALLFCIFFQLLLILDAGPNLEYIGSLISFAMDTNYNPSSDIGKYVHLAETGYYSFGKISIVSFIILFVLLFLRENNNKYMNTEHGRIHILSWISLVVAYFLYFLFSSVIDMQNRFFEFMIIPVILIFGNSNYTIRNIFCLYIFCLSFFIKYHVLQSHFFDIN